MYTALILLDLLAAFNTIDYSTLLSCLQTWFGIGGSVLKWFTFFLSRAVIINDFCRSRITC